MVTQDEARTRASAWYEIGPDAVGMHEFDLGWVVWEIPPPAEDPTALPDFIGSARGVVDRADGALTRWPSLPASMIAEQYGHWQEARGRFPEDIEEALAQSGWRPGRHVGDHAWGWLSELLEPLDGDEHGPTLHDAARTVVDEFGRLMVVQHADDPDARRLLRFYPLAFEALPDRDWRPDGAVAGRIVAAGADGPVCPVGVYQTGSDLGEVRGGSGGQIHLMLGEDAFLLGHTVDEALGTFVTAAPVVRLTGEDGAAAQPGTPQPGTEQSESTRGAGARRGGGRQSGKKS